MKTKKIIFYCLMVLPLVVVLIALQFLPGQIPVHYDINNQVNRWGSKYEILILPLFSILFGFIMLRIARFSGKQEGSGKNNENICMTAGILTLILFDAMTGYFLYAGFNKVENLSSVALDVNQLFIGILGISMVILGNIMPKMRLNSVMGLRTRWSMKNETTWKKSQRFGGISFVCGGIVMLVICFLTKGSVCLSLAMGVLAILVVIDVNYTYKISKKY